MPEKPESKRRRGRPETRWVKIDATPEEVAKAMFAAKPPDPSLRKAWQYPAIRVKPFASSQ